MIKLYFNEYRNRILSFVTAIVITAIAVAGAFLINTTSVRFCEAECRELRGSTFQNGYILNYRSGLPNEYIFSNADILLYLDKEKRTRIAAASAMEQIDICYTTDSLLYAGGNKLEQGQVIISGNVATEYNLAAGDTVFAEMAYSTELQKLVVTGISDDDFGIVHPSVNANLGVVVLGYIPAYAENVISKYVVFSSESLANDLSEFPQIINDVFSRESILSNIRSAAFFYLFWSVGAAVIVVAAAWVLILRQSLCSLHIRCRKGMPTAMVTAIFLTEVLLWVIFPFTSFTAIMFVAAGATTILNYVWFICAGESAIMMVALLCLRRFIRG